MKRIFSLSECEHFDSSMIGGKGAWLARLWGDGVSLPKTLCLSTEAYLDFVNIGGFREKVNLELNRKEFHDMRWEEIWDGSLRIRNLFLKTPLPESLSAELQEAIANSFGDSPLAIRSSAPDEDQKQASFAGLHDSFIGVTGHKQVAHCIKKVWSSLWSDRALLYRKELALSVEQSRMAVIIQELVEGEVSGICFTRDPLDQKKMMLEAVYGLNQGLVDGEISPDRWLLEVDGDEVVEHTPPLLRQKRCVAHGNSTILEDLKKNQQTTPPLQEKEVIKCARKMAELHEKYASVCQGPLDIEWTMAPSSSSDGLHDRPLFILQVRPVTALQQGKKKDERSWYLTLHRSFVNLQKLQTIIENEMLPEMAEEAKALAGQDLSDLSDEALAVEIRRRQQRNSYWTERYWQDCIPFAHGIRLFGEIYNDLLVPEDPHEFVLLLRGEDMLSLRRNTLMREIAALLSKDDSLRERVSLEGLLKIDVEPFRTMVAELLRQYGSYFSSHSDTPESKEDMVTRILLQYAKMVNAGTTAESENKDILEQSFLQAFSKSASGLEGEELLNLARASYRIRDDDNIYLGRIEEQAVFAVQEGKNRLADGGCQVDGSITPEEVATLLEKGKPIKPKQKNPAKQAKEEVRYQHRARQLIGQPASRGVARGKARVLRNPEDIASFKLDEILVVDSVDPAMTFFAPLAAAIVEQRGGMLIHGAIIAREYGIPCITGISGATQFITTGDTLTVDGYLGIVTLE